MVCQECQQRPATLHFTKIINGEKSEIHLCDHCAKEKGELSMFSNGDGFSFNNLLAGLLNFEHKPFQKDSSNAFTPTEVIQCERCKLTFQQFAKVGRFGCSNCYKAFQHQLDPVIRRLHSGNTVHSGKIPKRIGGSIHVKKQISLLRGELKDLIENEEFEQAAKLRDKIRELEASLGAPKGEGQ
ncbi:UvrB/UvrC motif-containing protein [Bacillus pinisoli]|uniref:UvrB/UvrC motif-containing protein n=1 Tax=Bacillus pinisoli TaxID=2901866 RepID=UPI001FF2B785|nr:UvrB/UvrC motif-containing protein [Bacillus pinisoli]